MLNTSTVSIDELRSNLADIVNRVTYANDKVMVKKYNRNAAILISVDEYEKLLDPTKRLNETEWKEKFNRLDEIRARIPKMDPDELDKIIDEEVAAVRAEKKKALGE